MNFKSEKGIILFALILMFVFSNLGIGTGINIINNEKEMNIVDRVQESKEQVKEAEKKESIELLKTSLQTAYFACYAEERELEIKDIEDILGVEVDNVEKTDYGYIVWVYYNEYYMKADINLEEFPVEIEIEIVE